MHVDFHDFGSAFPKSGKRRVVSDRMGLPCPDVTGRKESLKESHPQSFPIFGVCATAHRDDSGQDLAEYAILTALLVLIGILSLVGERIAAFYENVVGVLPFSG
jgi:Flp pilus assembly pilin Flp